MRNLHDHSLSDMQATDPSLASPILVSAHKIAIAGLGLIGGSIARRLVENHRFVTAWNHSTRPYEAARGLGIQCVDSLETLVAGNPDVLILALPLEVMGEALSVIAPLIKKGTTLTDVGSVKGPVRDEVKKAGLEDHYVGGHPMAGNELSGFEASDSALLEGALWALTFDDHTEYSRFLTIADMVTKGLKNSVIAIDDTTHDRAAALISHMPHVVSTALANELVDGSYAAPSIALALMAGSWRDMTRVSLTDPQRTRAMVELDAANVAQLLHSMAQRLEDMAMLLTEEEKEGKGSAQIHEKVQEFFTRSDPFRSYKHRVAAGTADCPPTSLLLEEGNWRRQLLDSALRGERVVDFLTTHEAQVIRRPLSTEETEKACAREQA
jgi:prephenate dehydrogenase